MVMSNKMKLFFANLDIISIIIIVAVVIIIMTVIIIAVVVVIIISSNNFFHIGNHVNIFYKIFILQW